MLIRFILPVCAALLVGANLVVYPPNAQEHAVSAQTKSEEPLKVEFKGSIILKENTVTIAGDIRDLQKKSLSQAPINVTIIDNLKKANLGDIQFQGSLGVTDTELVVNGTITEKDEQGEVSTFPIQFTVDAAELTEKAR